MERKKTQTLYSLSSHSSRYRSYILYILPSHKLKQIHKINQQIKRKDMNIVPVKCNGRLMRDNCSRVLWAPGVMSPVWCCFILGSTRWMCDVDFDVNDFVFVRVVANKCYRGAGLHALLEGVAVDPTSKWRGATI